MPPTGGRGPHETVQTGFDNRPKSHLAPAIHPRQTFRDSLLGKPARLPGDSYPTRSCRWHKSPLPSIFRSRPLSPERSSAGPGVSRRKGGGIWTGEMIRSGRKRASGLELRRTIARTRVPEWWSCRPGLFGHQELQGGMMTGLEAMLLIIAGTIISLGVGYLAPA